MEAFLVSTVSVAIAEVGDKTQLLSLVLAARFGRPLPIIAAILVATIANHLLAGALGAWISSLLGPQGLQWAVAISFILVAGWILIPDKLDEDEQPSHLDWGAFWATLFAFFIAEMGDKTQIATIVLAAQYQSLLWVVAGSTLGMLIANVPAVLAGNLAGAKLNLSWVRYIASALFFLLGVGVLLW